MGGKPTIGMLRYYYLLVISKSNRVLQVSGWLLFLWLLALQTEIYLAPQAIPRAISRAITRSEIHLLHYNSFAMNYLHKEVWAFRKTAEKVDNLDAMLKVKIPILNQLKNTVDVHGEAIARVSIELFEAVVSPIVVQGRDEVRHIRVEAGIGRPY